MKEKTILIITGPTATGKTKIGIKLANLFDGEIISSDSMQIYKHLSIGTAKPDDEEKSQAKHHLIDVVEPSEEFSVQQFVEKADTITFIASGTFIATTKTTMDVSTSIKPSNLSITYRR